MWRVYDTYLTQYIEEDQTQQRTGQFRMRFLMYSTYNSIYTNNLQMIRQGTTIFLFVNTLSYFWATHKTRFQSSLEIPCRKKKIYMIYNPRVYAHGTSVKLKSLIWKNGDRFLNFGPAENLDIHFQRSITSEDRYLSREGCKYLYPHTATNTGFTVTMSLSPSHSKRIESVTRRSCALWNIAIKYTQNTVERMMGNFWGKGMNDMSTKSAYRDSCMRCHANKKMGPCEIEVLSSRFSGNRFSNKMRF